MNLRKSLQKDLIKELGIMSPADALVQEILSGNTSIINTSGLEFDREYSELSSIMLDEETGSVVVVDYALIKDFSVDVIKMFCVNHGIYVIITSELCDWFIDTIGTDNLARTIEIGSGNGTLAMDLGIRGTDSKMQSKKEIISHYKNIGHSVINYPKSVLTMDAITAVKRLRPSIVIGCYITRLYNINEHDLGGSVYGVDELKVVKNVGKYYLVGRDGLHGSTSALMNHPNVRVIRHENIYGVVSRSLEYPTIIYECCWV